MPPDPRRVYADNNSSSTSNTAHRSCPLLVNINSVGSGLLFNYHFSYLNRQIGSTNNIVLTFTFNIAIDRERLSSSIFVRLYTRIESSFLHKCPTTFESSDLTSIESIPLQFNIESDSHRISSEGQTSVRFSRIGTNDFGMTVETIQIYHNELDLTALSQIQLGDDIRQWNIDYLPSAITDPDNEPVRQTFHQRDDPTKQCHFFPLNQRPTDNQGHEGVSTMKKTAKDCFEAYRQDPTNLTSKSEQQITRVRMVPVYYIIMPSSCAFGPPDTSIPSECDQIVLRGTITDPDLPDKIQLARAQREVLRSPPMLRYNRYFRRTYYYFDHFEDDDSITRYVFCAEYPFILSVLDQLQRCGQISSAQKYDEYLRFYNMLHGLLQFTGLSESICLIPFNNDGINPSIYADHQSVWQQIKDDMDKWYQTPPNDPSLVLAARIKSIIIDVPNNHQVILFCTDQTGRDNLAMTLIRDLKGKLERQEYIVENVYGNPDFINTNKRTIFICTERDNETSKTQIINAVQNKIREIGAFRDVFIFINDAIRSFPCRFLQSIPYLTFDLHEQSMHFTDEKINELFYYLQNMNVLSKSYTNNTSDRNLPCTSIGEGCAAALYFNYAKLLSPLSDHQRRMESMRDALLQTHSIELSNQQCKFIAKWVFVLPWTIKDTSKILSNAMSIDERDQRQIGFQLTFWKQTNHNLTVTVGGIFQRSYSPLKIYQLRNLDEGKSYYFPMEIPAALNGLENQYNDVRSHFHFGSFDPLEQAAVFRQKVEEFFANDADQTWHEHILLVSLDKPSVIDQTDHAQQTRRLFQTLWQRLSSLT